ncbi:hypothetical protein E2C01_081937 [Portunus trituberculatus]|uniref:Endonuclease/exonuclease/phosphatase domain-containing protein n=1 Tax=Portunus trituberculatus TaxID=210409 RepID=A0A5B7IZG1_PORTR|nr:hypothetical protein [Portunus trituberculatus]
MGDFNTHHQTLESFLTATQPQPHRNCSLPDPSGLSSPLPPQSTWPAYIPQPSHRRASVLDLFLDDSTFQSSQFSTGPYMGRFVYNQLSLSYVTKGKTPPWPSTSLDPDTISLASVPRNLN